MGGRCIFDVRTIWTVELAMRASGLKRYAAVVGTLLFVSLWPRRMRSRLSLSRRLSEDTGGQGACPPASSAGTGTPTTFEQSKYSNDRIHELELNRFTHKLEVERLKLLILLNGGAFTIFIGFVEKRSVGSVKSWMIVAMVAWLTGLVSAFCATQAQLTTQRSFTQSYHRRRRAIEWRLLGEVYSPVQMRNMIGAPPGKALKPGDEAFESAADQARERGERNTHMVFNWAVASTIFFLLGACAAILSVDFSAQTKVAPQPARSAELQHTRDTVDHLGLLQPIVDRSSCQPRNSPPNFVSRAARSASKSSPA